MIHRGKAQDMRATTHLIFYSNKKSDYVASQMINLGNTGESTWDSSNSIMHVVKKKTP